MARAIDDLEAIRRALDIEEWIVLGHSWGSDLAVRYALDHARRLRGIVGIAGHGLHRDREWSAAYEAGKANESPVEIDWVPEVHAALWKSFKDWIHQPTPWRALADSTVPCPSSLQATTFAQAGRYNNSPNWSPAGPSRSCPTCLTTTGPQPQTCGAPPAQPHAIGCAEPTDSERPQFGSSAFTVGGKSVR